MSNNLANGLVSSRHRSVEMLAPKTSALLMDDPQEDRILKALQTRIAYEFCKAKFYGFQSKG